MTSLADFLEREHDEFDARLGPVADAVSSGDWGGGLSAFRVLRDALETHIEAEERLLFPEVDRHLSWRDSPTDSLCDEHRELRCRMDWLAVMLANRDAAGFDRERLRVSRFLREHGERERAMVDLLSPSQRAALPDVRIG